WPEVRKLVGIDDRADAADLTADDIDRPHADQPLLCVEEEPSGTAVHLDRAPRHARSSRGQAEPVDERARDAASPTQGARERRDLAATVAGELDVVSEQRFEPGEVALLGRLKEPSSQLVAVLGRRLKPDPSAPPLLDVASR